MLSNNEYALLFWNMEEENTFVTAFHTDMGFPIYSNTKFNFREILGDAQVTYGTNYIGVNLKPHQCKLIKFTVENV